MEGSMKSLLIFICLLSGAHAVPLPGKMAAFQYQKFKDRGLSQTGPFLHWHQQNKEWIVGMPLTWVEGDADPLKRLDEKKFPTAKILFPKLPQNCEMKSYHGVLEGSKNRALNVLKFIFTGQDCKNFVASLRWNNFKIKFYDEAQDMAAMTIVVRNPGL